MGNYYNTYNAEEIIDWQDKKIGIVLLKHILDNIYNPLITYSDLAYRANFASGPRALDHHLGALSLFCKENGMPLISAVVINKRDGIPGNGFFTYFYGDIPEHKRYEKLDEEYQNIIKCRWELQRMLNWLEHNYVA